MMFTRSALTIALAFSLSQPIFAASTDAQNSEKLSDTSTNPSANRQNLANDKDMQPISLAAADQLTDQSDSNDIDAAPKQPVNLKSEVDLNTESDDTNAVDPNTENALNDAQSVIAKMPDEKKLEKPQSNSTAIKSPKSWTLDDLNNATWSGDLGKGQFVEYAKIQVLLNRFHSSPGVIDGISGMNMIKSISSFQVMNNLTASGEMDAPTWAALTQATNNDVFQSYTITKQDIDGPYVSSIPSDYADQAKMKSLGYVRVTEMLAERFHMDENFLKQLNPEATFSKAGETLIVANPREEAATPVSLIIAHKGAKHVYAFDANNKMIAAFPATIGSSDTPSPKGTYQVKAIAPNPWYGYNPKNFVQGKNMKPLSLPPGPNNPVGNMWIALSKPSFGIHGTPNPSLISKTASHGCIRLTNWDANALSKQVKKGVTVKFLE